MRDQTIRNINRRINGKSYPAEERRDGIQRHEFIKDADGNTLGMIYTGKWSNKVSARLNGRPDTNDLFAGGLTKDQLFSRLRVWIVEQTGGAA